jgi:zinc/manganese transport system substrate-binding protein
MIGPIPADRRRVVVPHRAFDYFGRAYGVAFLSPLGTNADAEATGSEMAGIVDKLRRGEADTVLAEHLEDRRVVERIAAEAHLPIAGELYSDSLSGPAGPAATYVDLMRRNSRLIAEALARPAGVSLTP